MEGRYMEDRDLKCGESYDLVECGKPIWGKKINKKCVLR